MRKLIMWNVVTLDGYFEGEKKWDLDFHNLIWGKELEEFSLKQLHETDFLVFGRVTYEGMAAYWKNEKGEIADLMNSLPKLVFSRTLKAVDWNNSQLISENASEEIMKRKKEGNGNMYLFGSADLSRTFIKDNLFDEYRIGIAPILQGKGTRLFSEQHNSLDLKLVSTFRANESGIVLCYTT